MDIYAPREFEPFEPEFKFFVDLMVRKLHINRHKGFAEGSSLADLLQGLVAELQELELAIENESQFAVALEAADVANFAFLTALAALKMSKDQFNQTPGRQLNEHS